MKRLRKKGFGILEVLLAGVIIIIILAALVFVAKTALNNAVYMGQRMQALYLAQEGIETIRQIRDTNYIDGKNDTKWSTLVWDTSDSKYIAPTYLSTYGIDYNSTSFRYRLLDGEEIIDFGTEYRRRIIFENIGVGSGDLLLTNPVITAEPEKSAVKVSVIITWDTYGGTKELVIEEIVANSRQGY